MWKLSGDSEKLVSNDKDTNSLSVMKKTHVNPAHVAHDPQFSLHSIVWKPTGDSEQLVSVDEDTIRLWDVNTGAGLATVWVPCAWCRFSVC